MSKNQNAPKSVTTAIDFHNIENLTPEQRESLARQLLSSLGVAKEVQLLAERKTAAQSLIETEVKRIDAEIETLRAEIAPINERIAALMTEKRNLGLKTNTGERTREVTPCPECGQGRHADNDKTKSCSVYAKYVPVRAAAKAAKTAVPTFAAFLATQ